MVATTADAAAHRRILRVAKMKLRPSHVRGGYVGAPGYPYGPPGPIRPMLVDFPPDGFFTPNGFVRYNEKIVTASVAEVPTIIPGVIGIGTGLTTDVFGAGTGLIGGGAGYVLYPVR